MRTRKLSDLEQEYRIDLDKSVEVIEREGAKVVLLQFPDGLKQYATVIVDYLREKTDAEFLIWLGQCFGACDAPVGIDHTPIDIMIQFGHNALMPDYLLNKS